MTRPIDSVIDFLNAEQTRGKQHVFLDEEARAALRELYIRTRTPARKPPLIPEATMNALDLVTDREPSPVPSAVTEATVSGDSKSEKLASLRAQAEQWEPALSLGTLREKMVFATGNPDADILLVGEAPGYNEERQGEPFVGPAGQKLDGILKAMGIKRGDVYISNLVKFRPALPRQTTNNRKPTPAEMAACLPLVLAEISVIQPKIVIALGGTAAEGLIGLKGTVTSMRGQWHEVSGIPARVTYHPSYLLQSGGSNDVKRKLWEDMLAAMENLGMHISEKQKSYFLPR